MGDVSLVYCLHCDRNCLKQHYQWSKFYYKFSNYSYYFIIISLFKQHDRWTVIICRRRQRSHGSGLVPAEWSSAARLTRISTRSITSGVLRCRSRVMPSVRIQNNVSSSSGTSATRRSNPLTSKHNHHIDIDNGSFHLSFWISLSLRTKTEPNGSALVSVLSWVQPITAARHQRLVADFAVFLCLFLNQGKSEVIFAH